MNLLAMMHEWSAHYPQPSLAPMNRTSAVHRSSAIAALLAAPRWVHRSVFPSDRPPRPSLTPVVWKIAFLYLKNKTQNIVFTKYITKPTNIRKHNKCRNLMHIITSFSIASPWYAHTDHTLRTYAIHIKST